jgi:hypothetical protein
MLFVLEHNCGAVLRIYAALCFMVHRDAKRLLTYPLRELIQLCYASSSCPRFTQADAYALIMKFA